ncbi:unnamed protein product [Ambrosiozyma monospora]|uniref:Unnamed protein product n=1 Tax=Ambrosiozyma monospora TaxID=43982 RepID=A0ACB5SXC9_AMBMO|nr:unnamed protein product [Ambrosiozyma monospora]
MAPIPTLLTSLLASSAFICTRTHIDQDDERVVTTCNKWSTSVSASTSTLTLNPDLSATSVIITSTYSLTDVISTPAFTSVSTPTTIVVETPNALIVARDEPVFDEDAWYQEALDEMYPNGWIDPFEEGSSSNDEENDVEPVAIEVTELSDEADIVAGVDVNEDAWNNSGAETQDATSTDLEDDDDDDDDDDDEDELSTETDQETVVTKTNSAVKPTALAPLAETAKKINIEDEVKKSPKSGNLLQRAIRKALHISSTPKPAPAPASVPVALSIDDFEVVSTSNGTSLFDEKEKADIISAYNQAKMNPERKKKETSGVLSCVLFMVVMFCVLFPTLEK